MSSMLMNQDVPSGKVEIHQSVYVNAPESVKVAFIVCDETMKKMGKWINLWF